MDNRQHVFDADTDKICIVIRVTDQQKYDTTLESLQILEIPEGMAVEICEIYDANSTAKAYNQAINQSNAKYKLYIQEGTRILNKKLLVEFIDLFTTEYRAGIAGVTGYEYIPVSCNVADTKRHYGHIHNMSGNDNFDWITPEKACKEVSFLDSYIVATQYDILWDENYSSSYFSAMAQSMMMKREGYSSIMINTGEYDIAISQLEAKFHPKEVKIFKESYYKEAFPLVSILIPTHNRPDYLREALESAINQTYKNLEILVSDDSDDDITYNMIQWYVEREGRMRYFYHKGINSRANINILSDNFSGEYINWLMDDDKLSPDKIEKMIDYYREFDNVRLVTSYRDFIDKDGNQLDIDFKNVNFDDTTIVNGISAIKFIIENNLNFIGEPTTVLLKTRYVKPINKMYLCSSKYQNIYYRNTIQWDIGTKMLYGMTDIMTWFSLLKDGDLVFINEKLSSFRMHTGQEQNIDRTLYIGLTFISMVLVLHYLYNKNKLTRDEYFDCLKKMYYIEYKRYSGIDVNKMRYENIDYSKEYIICKEYTKKELEEETIYNIFDIYEF